MSPTLGLRRWSVALAQSDLAHHRRLDERVEAYRLELVGGLNAALTNGSRTGDWEFTAGEELWRSLPAFEAESSPDFATLASRGWPGATALLWWFASACFAAIALGGLVWRTGASRR